MMKHYDKLKQALSAFGALPISEWLRILPMLQWRSLKKGEYFFRQDEEVHEIGFVIKGLLYNYYLDPNGKDFVKYFISENNFVACYSSLIQKRPAKYSCRTIEPTTLVTMPYKCLRDLYESHPVWDRIGRLNAEKLYIEKESREQYFLMADAHTRYNGFIKERPDLLQRVPQYLIASYIGISPISLSRLRSINPTSAKSKNPSR